MKMTSTHMEKAISLILLAGTILSAILVILGGSALLSEHGNTPLSTEILLQSRHQLSFLSLAHLQTHNLPVVLIELGLLCLVFTQILRVALLVFFYAFTQDFAYTLISLFILSILIYSTVFQ